MIPPDVESLDAFLADLRKAILESKTWEVYARNGVRSVKPKDESKWIEYEPTGAKSFTITINKEDGGLGNW